MKSIFALVAASFVSAAVAQDTPKPQFRGNQSGPKEPATQPAPAAAPKEKEDIGLIPETLEPVAKPKGTALAEPEVTEQKIDKTTAAQDEMNARVKMRELKTKFERDPKVQGELDRANSAKTDYEKREAMRSYYTLLYEKIAKADSSLKKHADAAKIKFTHRLDQTQIAPTEPLTSDDRNSEQ
jgi:hypothetical protein